MGWNAGFAIACLFLAGAVHSNAQHISTSEWQQLVPSSQLPEQVEVQRGNNNLDLVRFENRYYFSFRTAPTHFASEKTRLYILSSTDLESWEYEHEIHLGYDMREPRFVVFKGRLFFYFFEGGDDPLKFEPRHMHGTSLDENGKWAPLQNINLDGYVCWRFRVWDDRLYLSAYYGVGIYGNNHQPDLRLYESDDGFNFKPISEYPQVGGKGGEEGEFIFDEEGNLWATVRLEGGGAYIAYADNTDISKWQLTHTKHKYDSALLFLHKNDVYLVARRNLDGIADKAPKWWPENLRKNYNLARYSLTQKTTSLYKINKENKTADWVMDFPSTGDTAFPGIAQINENEFVLMNYSSDIDGPQKNWIRGQLGKTFIYWTRLTFHE